MVSDVRKTVMDYLSAELATADPAERADLLAKAEMILKLDRNAKESLQNTADKVDDRR